MSDLANVYQLFRSKFEDYDFQYYYPPTYIRMITESKDKIIFAFKEKHGATGTNSDMPMKSSPGNGSVSDNLNLAGSPLKDELRNAQELELSNGLAEVVLQKCWTSEEEVFGPLDTEEARSILQKFINLDCKVGQGDIWALCSGTDSDRTVLLQLAVNSDANDHRKFVRGVVRSTGVHACDSVQMAQLIDIHRQRANGMKFGQKIYIRQWYTICPHITLRLSWHTIGENACFSFERNAHIRLSQRFPVNGGEAFSGKPPADYFWRQLQRLAMMKDKILDIRANRESGYATDDICADGLTEMNLEYVKQKVNNILSTFISVQPTNFVHTYIAEMVELVRFRNLTDVMERLYDALTLCPNYDDLKAAIDYIFHLSTHSNIVNVPTTGTRFAQLILAMIQDRLAIPSLTPSEPYELLLECGFAKLMNDYRLIFAECGIYELEFEKLFQPQPTNTRKSRYASAVPQSMEMGAGKGKGSLFQPIEVTRSEKSILLSNFDEEEAKTKLNRLAQVHLLLEHLLSLETYVKIPSIYGRVCEVYLAQRPLSYGEVYTRDTDLLELDVNEFQLMDMVKKQVPYGRRVSMSSSNLLQKMETVFLQYGQPILPDCFFPESMQEDIPSKTEKYWCYEYDKIERL
uniref:Protein zwilch n=1 Tax=Anopheles atroparvus TaxID=41427 RepID=A0A182J7C9_ANOAO